MIPGGLFSASTVPLLEEVVNFAQSRHAVLAGNLANLDTPGYRGADLSPEGFEALLREALERRDAARGSGAPYGQAASGWPAAPGFPTASEPLSPGERLIAEASGAGASDPFSEVRAALPGLLRHDGNDVALEEQVSQIAKNQALHNLALALLRSQFNPLQTAISERV